MLPPAFPLLLIVTGMLLGLARWRDGRLLIWIGVGLLASFSLGPVADGLTKISQAGVLPLTNTRIQHVLAPDSPDGATRTEMLTTASVDVSMRPQAIVVLGGGVRRGALEEASLVAPSAATLERLAFAARIARASGLPILVSGGTFPGQGLAEAEVMKFTLEHSFDLPVRWLEGHSRDTMENARFSAQILRAAGVQRILLVTSAVHMQRSVAEFQGHGLVVTPAPSGFDGGGGPGWEQWIPRASALRRSSEALHEMLGNRWLSIRSD